MAKETHVGAQGAGGATAARFLFATGIECSYPVIAGADGRLHRQDELEKCGHYRSWRDDLRLVREDLGLTYLRYGPPLHRVWLGPGRYDWSFVDEVFGELRRLGIVPIADLCHFGTPDWLGNSFQNPEFAAHFPDYARAFAVRYPWVRHYTPVNEIFVCATFSALLGWWNERLTSVRSFVTALKHLAQANVLAEEAILQVRPDAVFIQSESSEYFHPAVPAAQDLADHFNHRRFMSLDLCYGQQEMCYCAYEFMLDNGMTRDELHWFMRHGRALKPHHVMGTDYYVTNEHLVDSAGRVGAAGEVFGYYVITKQYFDRYHLPVMHTETNIAEPAASDWLRKEWANMVRLKGDGVPIVGFTWYSLTDQVDWDTALREDNGRVNPLGLYDLDRHIRPVGLAYRELVAEWRDVLPAESVIQPVG
jgi:beta-glucosidase/6-phospho-beta-glucosidase/beta-galactosidase